FAGGHHERMDGKGYPRGLTREQMSIQARVMGIADVFEALTAADRPYKTGKTLSESLTILGRMKLDNHVDPDLFDVFLRERVYLEYAERFLPPEQIDEIDWHRIPGVSPELAAELTAQDEARRAAKGGGSGRARTRPFQRPGQGRQHQPGGPPGPAWTGNRRRAAFAFHWRLRRQGQGGVTALLRLQPGQGPGRHHPPGDEALVIVDVVPAGLAWPGGGAGGRAGSRIGQQRQAGAGG